ncbi:MAG: ankyrin repeat domain-containing protein, partial [Burkholderiales bacterium]
VDATRHLLTRGAEVNQPGWTPLMYAASGGHLNVARLLISNGAQVNATAENGNTPLMMAAREGHAAVVSLLLASGADAGLQTASGATAASIAQERKHPQILDLIAKHVQR